ncbi:type 1 glutamine amidotransferase family protein [Kineosporia babensis]|uniref:DUF3466 family protein n=1 Tax=Kineosporia babensis TaxID=499548 RepID=A0A9X1NIU0_9ACTN|nr:hypothetical protein [Kineosporia babensis]MCD5314855.1 hypothetical protein [Kineosporia babensis]
MAVTPAVAADGQVSLSRAATACTYAPHWLPVPDGFNDVRAYDSRNGVTVGSGMGGDGREHALRWENGVVDVLDVPSGWGSASQVNKHGVILGYDDLGPVVWKNGEPIRLELPEGAQQSVVAGLSDSGIVAATATIEERRHGLLWSIENPEQAIDLGHGAGDLDLSGVSPAGLMVGEARETAEGAVRRAVSGTPTTGFAPLAGLDPEFASSADQAAGRYIVGHGTPAGAWQDSPVLWKNGVASVLAELDSARDVNSRGEVVGSMVEDGTATSCQRSPKTGSGALYVMVCGAAR